MEKTADKLRQGTIKQVRALFYLSRGDALFKSFYHNEEFGKMPVEYDNLDKALHDPDRCASIVLHYLDGLQIEVSPSETARFLKEYKSPWGSQLPDLTSKVVLQPGEVSIRHARFLCEQHKSELTIRSAHLEGQEKINIVYDELEHALHDPDRCDTISLHYNNTKREVSPDAVKRFLKMFELSWESNVPDPESGINLQPGQVSVSQARALCLLFQPTLLIRAVRIDEELGKTPFQYDDLYQALHDEDRYGSIFLHYRGEQRQVSPVDEERYLSLWINS